MPSFHHAWEWLPAAAAKEDAASTKMDEVMYIVYGNELLCEQNHGRSPLRVLICRAGPVLQAEAFVMAATP